MFQKAFLLFAFLVNSLLSVSQSLVIYDEFDSTHLNTRTWNTKFNWGPNMSLEQDKQIFLAKNATTENGKLKLVLKEEPGCYDTWRFCDSANCNSNCVSNYRDPACGTEPKCQIQGDHCLCLVPKPFKYTAGMIASVDKFRYGVFEMKCKIPKDCFPAFWLFGDCCSEIDIFEFLGCEEDNASITLHQCPKRNCSNNLMCGESLKTLKSKVRPDFAAAFHTWKLDWKHEGLSVYVDDTLIYHCNSKGPGACLYNTFNTSGGSCTTGTHSLFPDGPMQLIANLATNPNDCPPPTPSVMEVEYIKIWQY